MSLLAMDTSSLFDPFEFPSETDVEPPKPQPKFREKLEIKTLRHQDHHLKDMMVPRDPDSRNRDFMETKSRQHDVQPKVHMLDSPSPTTALGVSDVQSARQKLRDSLASALNMVVSKQLVKSVLGVGEDAAVDGMEEVGAGQNTSTLEVSHPASLTEENRSPKDGQTVDSLVVDLGPLESETLNIDSMGGEVSVPEFVANVGDYRLSFEQGEYGEDADVVESPFKKLKTGFGHLDYVHRKLEIEEKEGRIAIEDVHGGIHIVDQARKLATDIEAELFKLCGSKKTYNQKARSLLFNLKDKSNPELRARVFSGEIPPADLCRMTGEQLASKELSDWRNAKEQALDKLLVLTDADTVSGKVVKKTHKGEFIVDVQNESTVDIVPVVTRSVFPVDKVEEKVQQEASEQLEAEVNQSPNKSKYGSSPSQKRSRSGEIDRVGVSFSHSSPPVEEPNTMEMTTTPELVETETVLPTIMSLDEYMEAQEEEGGVQEDVFEDAPIEPRGSTTPSFGSEVQEASDKIDPPSTIAKAPAKEDTIRKHGETPKVKPVEAPPVVHKQKAVKSDKSGVAWTGHIQLSGNRQSPLVVRHRSGENVDLKNWPKSLELKGRVRLAHLDKFLQELQQSRSRAVTVVSILMQDGHADQASATDHVKEVANQYQMGERVGFVEPRSGYELYLLPPGNGTTKLLSEHGHPEVSAEALDKDVVLVGVIVWRRSHLSSSSRLPDRNKNVKRHAVASSAHHHESKSSHRGAGMGSSSKDQPSEQQARSSRPTQRGSSTTAVTSAATTSNNNVNPTAAAVAATATSMHHHLKFPVESSPTREPSSSTRNWQPPVTPTPPSTSNAQQVLKSHHILPAPSDATTDMPPGFSLRPAPASRLHLDPRPPPADIPPGFWPRPAAAAAAAEEDDDLPEFDFSVHAVAGPPRSPPGQFNALEPPPSISHLSQFPRHSPSRVPSEQGAAALPPPPSEFSQYPPRPPGPPPPPQDTAGFLPRPNNYYPSAAPISHENDQFRPEPLRVGMVQYGNGAATPLRNDLPEWRPSAQFQQLRPVYENQQQHLHFDPAAAVGGAPPPQLPVQQQQQDLTWPSQQQAVPPTLLPPPPPPPQWQAHFQPQWQQHSNHFQAQQQQHLAPPVRPVDPRAGPFNSWESAAGAPAAPPMWDAAGARNSNNSNEHHRANGDHRLKDPRSNEQQFSWHDSRDNNNNNNRESNGGRPDFRRR